MFFEIFISFIAMGLATGLCWAGLNNIIHL